VEELRECGGSAYLRGEDGEPEDIVDRSVLFDLVKLVRMLHRRVGVLEAAARKKQTDQDVRR
jgi:hypothetical protein